jgi:hypothetical protein
MSSGDFQISDGKLLMIRLGPMNGQIQTHRGSNAAPFHRGIWAFPYPFHDAFFYCHVWRKYLPKRFIYPVMPEENVENYEQKMIEYNLAVDNFDWKGHDKKCRT